MSATTALQLLRDDGKVRPGQKVLVNGASGGVGTFAVQIAKAFGAEVTGVTSTKNVDLVRAIGADHVIDYTREDFTTGGPRYDLILDNVGNHSMAQTRRALTPRGTLISNGGGHAGGKLGRTLRAMLASMVVRQQAGPSIKTQNHDDLVALKDLVEAGKVTPVIDATYVLERDAAGDRSCRGRTRPRDDRHRHRRRTARTGDTTRGALSPRPCRPRAPDAPSNTSAPSPPPERNHHVQGDRHQTLHRQPRRIRGGRRRRDPRPSRSRSRTTSSSWPATTSPSRAATLAWALIGLAILGGLAAAGGVSPASSPGSAQC